MQDTYCAYARLPDGKYYYINSNGFADEVELDFEQGDSCYNIERKSDLSKEDTVDHQAELGLPTSEEESADWALRDIIGFAGLAAIELTFTDDGNYDGFGCSNWRMKPKCDRIMLDLDQIVIVKDSPQNSQKMCIYAKMQHLNNYWMCADSSFSFGFTTVDPAITGYCLSQTTKCPPTTKSIQEWDFNFD